MVRDLRTEPPRRWNEELGGVAWLPRIIDKARAHRAGLLGSYLYGHSPYDDAFLGILGLTYAAFSELVAAAADDDAVLRALDARDPVRLERLAAGRRRSGPSTGCSSM